MRWRKSTACATYGARGVGIDIDPNRIREAKENAKKAGVENLVHFEENDLFPRRLSRGHGRDPVSVGEAGDHYLGEPRLAARCGSSARRSRGGTRQDRASSLTENRASLEHTEGHRWAKARVTGAAIVKSSRLTCTKPALTLVGTAASDPASYSTPAHT